MLRQVSNNGIVAVGMTLVILTGGIDLSVGSVLALGSVLCAMLLTMEGWTSASVISIPTLAAVLLFLIVWIVPSLGAGDPARPEARSWRIGGWVAGSWWRCCR